MTITTTSEAIDTAVSAQAMLSHPFYRAWSDGQLSLDTLRGYAGQYFHHVEAFPRAISTTHAACPDPRARRLLAENLAEEEGLGEGKDAHADLWLMFAEGLGADLDEVRSAELEPETHALIDAFRSLSRSSYASGLGALYAYESQFPAVAAAKIEGLKSFYGIGDERTLRFFRVHETADVEHAGVCRALLDALPADEKAEAIAAGERLAGALYGFLSGVERRYGLN